MQSEQHLAHTGEISQKVMQLLTRRLSTAQKRYSERYIHAWEEFTQSWEAPPATPWAGWEAWQAWLDYTTDFGQRSILFWDTLRRRGNDYLERERSGLPPVLHFEYETIMDGRRFERPVNYALLRIIPPADVTIDPQQRPYLIIDPRAGHGPGIGGFKDDSQVGVALRAGHPVYFVIFFPNPEPGQTMLDVCEAERQFVRKVHELHPQSAKPAIVGNCQGGWAAMMLASSSPQDTGPIVINGAPMSYWGGAWREDEGDNPMRYSGGLLGGTWLSSFTTDLANGVFDGAWLVQNFENLNPANTFWDKYYHLFANIDTEPERFLDFERWWGGFYLMNREEIEWITQNLFVGNRLWSGEMKSQSGGFFDLREIKSPIVLFASMGDNITPPQQAFNWVADVFGSTEEIKARGQVIVGLLHETVGHLGIFVSGKVAKKEHAQIVSVLTSIEALAPGLYGMQISERPCAEGDGIDYEVQFIEHRLEEITERLNRFQRSDEKAFEAVAAVSEFNQRAYELFARPLVQALANDAGAQLQRDYHPLRLQRWALSDLNPWLWWLGPAAAVTRTQRRAVTADQPYRRTGRTLSTLMSASFDYYRDARDAFSEAAFFQLYGGLFALDLAGSTRREHQATPKTGLHELPFIRDALAAITEGGYPEALARAAFLLAHRDKPLPLSRLQLKQELIEDYRALLPDLPADQQRRIRGEQEIIVLYEPAAALETLPQLLTDPAERDRFLTLLEKILSDQRVVQTMQAAPEQTAMLARIRQLLAAAPAAPPADPPAPVGLQPAPRRVSTAQRK